jgi:hypothetical protein
MSYWWEGQRQADQYIGVSSRDRIEIGCCGLDWSGSGQVQVESLVTALMS